MINNTILSALILTFLALSCSSDTTITTPTPSASLTLNLIGLEALGDNFQYEGWIVNGSDMVSTGKFSSVTFPQTVKVEATKLLAAKEFIVSIEPIPDTDPNPAATKILKGSFADDDSGTAELRSTGVVADFSNATGAFILATPTDGNTNANEGSGIWFLDNSAGAGNEAAGLNLPTLQPGWKYEGWVMLGSKSPLSTGTFMATIGKDDNASTSPYKGNSADGPSFPGEDFLNNAPQGHTFPTSLTSAEILISVEPDPDNDPAMPFTFRLLANDVRRNPTIGTTLYMGVGPVSLLSGVVKRK